jgi:hypothetical protein
MHTLEGLPLHGHYQQLMSTQEVKFAWAVLHEFFEAFGEDGPKDLLWFMLAAVMKSDNEEITSRHRGNLIFFFEYSQAFYKAIHTIYKKHGSIEL